MGSVTDLVQLNWSTNCWHGSFGIINDDVNSGVVLIGVVVVVGVVSVVVVVVSIASSTRRGEEEGKVANNRECLHM